MENVRLESVKDKCFSRFLVVWIGQLISSIGSGLTAFALGVYAYNQTHTATSFTLVTLCGFLPSILLNPFGGVLADRFDRRIMMVLGDLGSALGLIMILIIMITGHIELWQIYLGVTISSIFVAVQAPAYKASTTDLVTEDQFSKASGMLQLASSSQFLLSPIIAGFLLGITDIKTILIIDISSFIIAVSAVLFIKKDVKGVKKDKEKQNILSQLADGWKAITENRGVLMLILLISVVTFYIGFLQTLVGPMILTFTTSKTLGITQSISAIGALVSSIYISAFCKTQKHTTMLFIGLALTGLFFSLMGIAANIYFIAFSGFMFFFSLTFVNTSCDVLVRKNIENEKQGRAWGIIAILSQLGFVAAYTIAGFLADHIFNPLLVEDGGLASTVGKVVGVGQGRGIGFLFVISGIFVIILAFIAMKSKSIHKLEKNNG